jgi:hypothetical protein
MHRYFCIILMLVLCPAFVFAQEASSTPASAGFATAPIWLSSAAPVEGDALKIFAVVNNASGAAIVGDVSFLVDGVVVGSVAKVSLAKGAAQLVSTGWKATKDTHALTASFDAPSGSNTAGPVQVSVAPAPPAPAVVQALTAAVGLSGDAISGVRQAVEDFRQSGINYFAGRAATTPDDGSVLGTSNVRLSTDAEPAAYTAAGSSLFNRLGSLLFENPMYFYPALLLFCFFILWAFMRIFSRD